MAPTVAEILKQSGYTDAEIAALDQRAIAGFTQIISTAAAEREQAELAKRAGEEMWDTKVSPALNQWGNEKANLTAERDFYRAQAQGAKEAGFLPKDVPGYQPPANGGNPGTPNRAPNGEFVAGAGVVPGSPAYMTKAEGFRAVSNGTWFVSEHMRLHGTMPPDDIDTLAAEAASLKLDFRDHVARKYKFNERKNEIAAAAQKEHDDKIRAEAIKERDQYYAERGFGSNPNTRVGTESQFTTLKAGVDSKAIKDPLSMSKAERTAQTSHLIQKDIAANEASRVH